MHLKLDDEIVDVEKRIAGRKTQISYVGKATGKRAMDGLASPVTLAGALALGFAMGGRLGRKRPPERRHDRAGKAKVTGVVGLLLSSAMWFVRAQYGSPMGLAQALMQKFQHRKAPRQYPARELPPRV